MSGRIVVGAVKPGWPMMVTRLWLCLCLGIVVWSGSASAVDRTEPKRIVLLHSFGRDFRPWSEFARSIKAELEQRAPWPLDIQEHALLSARFNNPGPEQPFVDYLRSLYEGCPPDIVVSVGAPAARFAQKYRTQLFPETPMVLTAVEQRLVNRAELTDGDAVISVQNDFAASFSSILHVLPDTRTIAVVLGASSLEKFWLDEIRKEAKPFEDRVSFEWYSGLSFQEILTRASALPQHTVLFWGLLSVDGAGVTHEGDAALRRLHAIANAPIFSYQEAFFGGQTVGGPMHSNAESGRRTADAVFRILAGEKPRSVSVEAIQLAAPRYDWREMQRWGINEKNLPLGSEVLYREPTIWETHRWQMVLIAAVILMQAGLISGLLHQHRWRRLAEVESRQRLAELAHVNRYAAVGELTTSIAHELNQPLGSILTNAETAELMLKSASPDLAEIREILADIRRDDQRASEVIRRLRSILRKTPFETAEIDLNETVGEAIGFLRAVADRRRIALRYAPAGSALYVKGDTVQLQQVILNLIINAIDALAETEARTREVGVTTARVGAFAEIRIEDSGPGIASGDLKDVFNPFFTTKPQGMGMGLAIGRTIVEAHRGQILAQNKPTGGALFTIRLPIAG